LSGRREPVEESATRKSTDLTSAERSGLAAVVPMHGRAATTALARWGCGSTIRKLPSGVCAGGATKSVPDRRHLACGPGFVSPVPQRRLCVSIEHPSSRLCGAAHTLWSVLVIGAALMPAPQASAGDELARYVDQPDGSYAIHTLRRGSFRGADYVEAVLTSQTWRGIAWKHQLFIVSPRHLDLPVKQALLFIDGGSWDPQYESTSARALRTGPCCCPW